MKISAYAALSPSEQKARLEREWEPVKERRFREKRSAEWVELDNTRKIAAMLQASTEEEEEDEDAGVLGLGEAANQAAPPQRTLSDGRVKLKRRFKFG